MSGPHTSRGASYSVVALRIRPRGGVPRDYVIAVERATDGRFTARVPDEPDLTVAAESYDEALAEMRSALAGYSSGRRGG